MTADPDENELNLRAEAEELVRMTGFLGFPSLPSQAAILRETK